MKTILLVLVVSLSACKTDAPYTSDVSGNNGANNGATNNGSANNGTNNGATNNGEVACDGPNDCGDDQVCVDEACRDLVCDPGAPPSCENEALTLCDETGTDPTTVDCRDTGQFCDGEAAPPRCRDRICAPGSKDCQGDVARVCNDRGTAYEETPCETGSVCFDGSCQELLCDPNAIGCLDEATAYLCDSSGTSQEAIECGDQQYCQEGQCLDEACRPNEVRCDDNTLVTCDPLGAEATAQDCDTSSDECGGNALGCACVVDGCVLRVCDADVTTCVGNATRSCDEFGTGYNPIERCGEEEICLDGACLERVCEPLQTRCQEDTLLTCDETGTNETETDCQENSAFCANFEVPACAPHRCIPRAPYCLNNAVVVCDDRGAGPSEGPPLACEDGVCIDGECIDDPCIVAERQDGPAGCRFYSLDLDQIDSGVDPTTAIALHNVGDGIATVTMTLGDELVETQSVAPGGTTILEGLDGPTTDGTMFGESLLLVTTDEPVVAWQFNTPSSRDFTADASALLPFHNLGTEYIIASWKHRRNQNLILRGFLTVAAVEPNTEVTITPTADIAEGDDIPAIEAGETVTFSLEPGQYLNLETDGPDGADLTGTRVSSTTPIAVFGGHECANVPSNLNWCDHLEEQLPPLTKWGTVFLVPTIARRAENDREVIRVIAAEDDTTVRTSPAQDFENVSLEAGQYLEFTANGAFRIDASAPVLVVSYTRGGSQDLENQIGDPSMVLIAPLRAWTPRASMIALEDWDTQRALILAPRDAEILVDGELAPEAERIGDTDFVQVAVEVEPGLHTFTADMPIYVVAYGHGPNSSYAAPATY
jgi:hypothetical protein